MVAYQRGVTWGGFLLVLGTIALLSIVRLPFPDEENLGFFLWYWLGWASLGAFSGMTIVVARATRDLRVLWHVAVSVLTILCLSLLLGDQDVFRNGPANLLCSLVVVALLWKCMVVNRQLPAGVRSFARPITTVTALAVVLRLAAPPHFFLPILYGPEAALARSRAEIVTLFLSAMAAALIAGWFVLRFRSQGRSESEGRISFLEQTISRGATFRIVGCLAALFGTLVFLWCFVLGLCSMNGGWTYPHFGLRFMDQTAAAHVASEYLTTHGAQRTSGPSPAFWYRRSRQGEPFASFEYPLHFGRSMSLAIFPDRDSPDRVLIAFDCTKVTASDMVKANRFTTRMREDFLKQAIEFRQANGGE